MEDLDKTSHFFDLWQAKKVLIAMWLEAKKRRIGKWFLLFVLLDR